MSGVDGVDVIVEVGMAGLYFGGGGDDVRLMTVTSRYIRFFGLLTNN